MREGVTTSTRCITGSQESGIWRWRQVNVRVVLATLTTTTGHGSIDETLRGLILLETTDVDS